MFQVGQHVICFFKDNPAELLFREATILEPLPQSKVGPAEYLVHVDRDPKECYNRILSERFILPRVYEVLYMLKRIVASFRSNSLSRHKYVLFDIEHCLGRSHLIYQTARRRFSTEKRHLLTDQPPVIESQRQNRRNKRRSKPQVPKKHGRTTVDSNKAKAEPKQTESDPINSEPKSSNAEPGPVETADQPSHERILLDLIPSELMSFAKSRMNKRYPRRSRQTTSLKPNVINILEDYFVRIAKTLVNRRDQEEAFSMIVLTKEFVIDLRDMFDFYASDWLLTERESLGSARQVGWDIGDILERVREGAPEREEGKSRRLSRLSACGRNEVLDELVGFAICGAQYYSGDHPSLCFGIEQLARLLCVFPKIVDEPPGEGRFAHVCHFFRDFCLFIVEQEDLRDD